MSEVKEIDVSCYIARVDKVDGKVIASVHKYGYICPHCEAFLVAVDRRKTFSNIFYCTRCYETIKNTRVKDAIKKCNKRLLENGWTIKDD